MIKKALIIVLIFLCFILTGCATTTCEAPYSGYNIFFTPCHHLTSLIKEKKYSEAEQVYERELNYFEKCPDKCHDMLEKLKTEINGLLYLSIDKMLSEIESIKWPAEYKEWNRIASLLDKANDTVSSYEKHIIFKNTDSRLSSIDQLKSKIDIIKKKIIKDTDRIFSKYLFSSLPDFFKIYPVIIDPVGFFKTYSNELLEQLETAKAQEIKKIHDTYKQYLPKSICILLGLLHYKNSLADHAATIKPSFADILYATKETCTSGFPLKEIPDVKVALLEVTSQTLLKGGQIEFSVAIDIDLPFATERTDIDKAFDCPISKDADIIIIFDVAVARCSRDITNEDCIESEYQSATRTEPNPDYNLTQNKVNIARQEVAQAQMDKFSIDSQYCYGLA